MAITVDSVVATLSIVGGYSNAADLETIKAALSITSNPTAYANGTGNNQIDLVHTDTITLSATSQNYDLDAGTVTNGFGLAQTYAKVKLLYIRNKSTTSGQTLTITGDFTALATVGFAAGGLIIGAGGFLCLDNPLAGYAVTAGTGDVITVTNSVEFAYDIVILGTTV